jgi:hypothetical protein
MCHKLCLLPNTVTKSFKQLYTSRNWFGVNPFITDQPQSCIVARSP